MNRVKQLVHAENVYRMPAANAPCELRVAALN